jgi:hypothetical protein
LFFVIGNTIQCSTSRKSRRIIEKWSQQIWNKDSEKWLF